MAHSVGAILIIGGMAVVLLSQILIGIHAFAGNPVSGIMCFVMPFYVLVYAKRHSAGRALMRAWYAGLAALVAGVFLST
ncbi:hypothetical protein B7G54_24340 [Burkholderia puraquae]|uniref:Uncharacterized protein n=1 Tax=Burkholderia puraquae TaxID=1904757 RepID=A0A1X1PCP5_9BURK|nr:hypothetical protein B7G54_24340 [Burkholderia puraquae]